MKVSAVSTGANLYLYQQIFARAIVKCSISKRSQPSCNRGIEIERGSTKAQGGALESNLEILVAQEEDARDINNSIDNVRKERDLDEFGADILSITVGEIFCQDP